VEVAAQGPTIDLIAIRDLLFAICYLLLAFSLP
jgi:hypothetical protein